MLLKLLWPCSINCLRLIFPDNSHSVPEKMCSSAHSWVSSVAVCRGTDLAASGAGNGIVRLWEIENDAKGVRPLFELPLVSSCLLGYHQFANSAWFYIIANERSVTSYFHITGLIQSLECDTQIGNRWKCRKMNGSLIVMSYCFDNNLFFL